MNTKHLARAGTFSKDLSMFGFPEDDHHIAATGTGSLLKTVDGTEKIDWISALGANLYGYNKEFMNYVLSNMLIMGGASFSVKHKLEDVVAEKICYKFGSRIPNFSKTDLQVRFSKTGTDTTTMAIRVARAVTGKPIIMIGGYHGWASEFVAATPPAHGIPIDYERSVRGFKIGDINDLQFKLDECRGDVAAIIVEHPLESIAVGNREWYQFLRKKCDELGALLVIDEVVTGLRFGVGGVCEMFGIEPDLVCYGKALGSGFSISALLGPKEYMSWFERTDPVFCSSTFWGETTGLIAANYVLDNWTDREAGLLMSVGRYLSNGLNRVGWTTKGFPEQRTVTFFKNNLERTAFIGEMFKRGILMNRPNIVNYSHTIDDANKTIDAARDVLSSIINNEGTLKKYEGKEAMVLFSNR